MTPAGDRVPSTAGCWPNSAQDLLLTAALAEPDAAARAWEAWRGRADVDAIDPASFRLLPLIYLNNAGRGVFGDDDARLRGVYRQNWARNHRRIHVASKAIAELSRAGIATLGLKGLVLGLRYYGNVGARSMADIDLVTRDDEAYRALEVLEASGWRLLHPPFARERRRGGSTALVNAAGDELDLHWHVLLVQPFASVDEAFWQGAEAIEIGGVPSRALQPADELLHTIVHGLHWNPINSLRWIADAVTLLRRAPHVDWDRLIDAAARYCARVPRRHGAGLPRRQVRPHRARRRRRPRAVAPVDGRRSRRVVGEDARPRDAPGAIRLCRALLAAVAPPAPLGLGRQGSCSMWPTACASMAPRNWRGR